MIVNGARALAGRLAVVAGLFLPAIGVTPAAFALVGPAAGTGDAAGRTAVADDPGVPAAANDGSAGAGRLGVALKPSARVAGRWVRLGDVAELSGLGEVRLAALRDARLQRTPPAGGEKVLGAEELSKRLRALGVVEPFTIGGADTTVIEASVRSLGGDELVRFGHEYLAGRAGGAGADVQIEDPATPRSVTVPEGEVEFRAEAPSRRLAGLVPLAVEAWSGGERVARVLLSYRVRARAAVVRAARALEPGQVIAEDDLAPAELDLAGVPEDALTTADALVGQRVTRPVAAGGWVRRGAVAQPLKVKRGATVSVIAKIGNVTAKASAQSRQDGAAGEIITVINPASKRTLRARVVDENVVEAVLP